MLTTTLLALVTVLLASSSPASAHPKYQLIAEEEAGVGFFYGTFNESPNTALLVGGTAEQFCEANPEDPFSGEPGTATQRVYEGADGVIHLTIKSKSQPIYLYKIDFAEAPPWIEHVCAGYFAGEAAPEPFATGTARLRSRVSIVSDDYIDIFNSVRGVAYEADGTKYRVKASADLVVENGVPVGDPEDFVTFKLKKVRR